MVWKWHISYIYWGARDIAQLFWALAVLPGGPNSKWRSGSQPQPSVTPATGDLTVLAAFGICIHSHRPTQRYKHIIINDF